MKPLATSGKACALLLGTLLCWSPPVMAAGDCARVVISGGSDYPPLHWYNGKVLTGASMEVAATAFAAIGVPYEIRYYGPFVRALKGAERGEIDVLATLKDTDDRSRQLEFVPVPLFSSPIAIFVAHARPIEYHGWNDLASKKGGATTGYTYGEGFDQFLRDKLKVEYEQKTYMNFDKLDAGRIDYLITGYYNGLAFLAQSGQLGKFDALHPYVTDSSNYIAFSKASPCMKYSKPLARQLRLMVDNGTIKDILERHTRELLSTRSPSALPQ